MGNICECWLVAQLESNDLEWIKVKVFVSHVNITTTGHPLLRKLLVIKWTKRGSRWTPVSLFLQPPWCSFQVPMYRMATAAEMETMHSFKKWRSCSGSYSCQVLCCPQQRPMLSPWYPNTSWESQPATWYRLITLDLFHHGGDSNLTSLKQTHAFVFLAFKTPASTTMYDLWSALFTTMVFPQYNFRSRNSYHGKKNWKA